VILGAVDGIGGCERPAHVLSEALERWPDIEDLPAEAAGIALAGCAASPSVSVDVPPELVSWLASRGLTPERVLVGFAHDLAETKDSHGGDERMLASQWFDSVIWPEPDVEDEGGDGLSPSPR
jgi:hypothetical protein